MLNFNTGAVFWGLKFRFSSPPTPLHQYSVLRESQKHFLQIKVGEGLTIWNKCKLGSNRNQIDTVEMRWKKKCLIKGQLLLCFFVCPNLMLLTVCLKQILDVKKNTFVKPICFINITEGKIFSYFD